MSTLQIALLVAFTSLTLVTLACRGKFEGSEDMLLLQIVLLVGTAILAAVAKAEMFKEPILWLSILSFMETLVSCVVWVSIIYMVVPIPKWMQQETS